ncbi:glycosyltransferase family 2 protein [bacterium]|nr:glycosyltransferase family 2 protein [bacterium]
MFDLTVVIPCLNEEKTIVLCIEKCKQVFERLNILEEIIVVDNGSIDKTAEISRENGARVVFCSGKGYGNALRFGFQNCNSKYILMGDADNTYDFLEIPLLWNKLEPDVDMITGSRIRGNIEKGAMPFLNRYLGNPVLTFVLNLLYGTKISDSQCGMRLMKKECLDSIEFKTTGMEFASELFVEFAKHKFKIVETPVSLYKDIEGRIPHLRPWRDGLRHLTYLVKARFTK